MIPRIGGSLSSFRRQRDFLPRLLFLRKFSVAPKEGLPVPPQKKEGGEGAPPVTPKSKDKDALPLLPGLESLSPDQKRAEDTKVEQSLSARLASGDPMLLRVAGLEVPDESRWGPKSKTGFLLWSTGAVTLFAAFFAYLYYEHLREKSNKLPESRSLGRIKLGGPYQLIDENSHPVTEKSFFGKYVILYFGFTHCPDICPKEMRKIEAALPRLTLPIGATVQPVFISVDPVRDTPKRLQEYKKGFHPAFKWLTGTFEQVKQVAQSFRVYVSEPQGTDEDYLVDHSVFFYVMNRQGECIEILARNLTEKEFVGKISQAIARDFNESQTPTPTPQEKPLPIPVPSLPGSREPAKAS